MSNSYAVVEVNVGTSIELIGAYAYRNPAEGETVVISSCEYGTVGLGIVRYSWSSTSHISFDYLVEENTSATKIVHYLLSRGINCTSLSNGIEVSLLYVTFLKDAVNSVFGETREADAIIRRITHINNCMSNTVKICYDAKGNLDGEYVIPYAAIRGEVKVEITLSPEEEYIYANAEEEEEAKIGAASMKRQAEHEAAIMDSDFDYGKCINDSTLSDEMPF